MADMRKIRPRRSAPSAEPARAGDPKDVAASAAIKNKLLSLEDQENGGGEAVLPKGEAGRAEHVEAAEGAMTFRTLGEGRELDWMDVRLEEIAKEYETGPHRPQRSPLARRVFGA
jgi:hypothetical protein